MTREYTQISLSFYDEDENKRITKANKTTIYVMQHYNHFPFIHAVSNLYL